MNFKLFCLLHENISSKGRESPLFASVRARWPFFL